MPKSMSGLAQFIFIAHRDNTQALGRNAVLLGQGGQINDPIVTGDHNIIMGTNDSQTIVFKAGEV